MATAVLADRVERKEISANAAAISVGIRKKPSKEMGLPEGGDAAAHQSEQENSASRPDEESAKQSRLHATSVSWQRDHRLPCAMSMQEHDLW